MGFFLLPNLTQSCPVSQFHRILLILFLIILFVLLNFLNFDSLLEIDSLNFIFKIIDNLRFRDLFSSSPPSVVQIVNLDTLRLLYRIPQNPPVVFLVPPEFSKLVLSNDLLSRLMVIDIFQHLVIIV